MDIAGKKQFEKQYRDGSAIDSKGLFNYFQYDLRFDRAGVYPRNTSMHTDTLTHLH